jgi:MoaA/NifB/PqqE/SkfB family radical SAM enzyme
MRQCTYCAYESSPRVTPSGELSQDQWVAVLEELKRCGVFYVRFTGGDPFTRPDAIAILQTASDLGFGVSVASDLTVLSEKDARELTAVKNLIHIQTTLDGATASVADSQRGSGNFHRVLQGLDLLRRLNIPVVVGTVVTKLNACHIAEIAELLSRWGNVVGYGVSPLYGAGRGRLVADLAPSMEELASAYEQFATVVARGLVKPIDPAWHPLAAGLTADERRYLWADQPNLVRSPDRLLRIDPRGRMYTSIHLKERIGDDVYIGNAMCSDIVALWHDAPTLTRLRGLRKHHPYFGDVVDITAI